METHGAVLQDNFLAGGATHPSGEMGYGQRGYGGGVVDGVQNRNFTRLRRPYLDSRGRPTIALNLGRWTKQDSTGGERRPLVESITVRDYVNNYCGGLTDPVLNATALRKEEWLEFDRQALRAARYELRAWTDLAAANTFGGFNGMGKMMLEHETMSDPGEAVVDMDGLTEGRSDQPMFQLEGLPLPITHMDFWMSKRKLDISRNTGTPLDTTMGEAAARRVAASVERTTIGVDTGVTYGGNSTQVGGYGRTSKVYGYTNFTPRLTKTNVTAPSAGGWAPTTTLNDLETCLNTLKNQKFRGPFMVYNSTDWDPYLNQDYYYALTSGAVAPTKSLRTRLKENPDVIDIRRLDLLQQTAKTDVDSSGVASVFTWIIVQMTPDVARAVNGMDITTVQWESVGGMRLNFKVMAIQVPQLRADFYGNVGIMQATTA